MLASLSVLDVAPATAEQNVAAERRMVDAALVHVGPALEAVKGRFEDKYELPPAESVQNRRWAGYLNDLPRYLIEQ
ncbi:hypothetical protein HJB52_03895 [Rhizobium lentis]|uniref:hypothetical protein n=1 Tax=Rhizobium lentis TaxID=1138194 RepID=UPI001C830FD0|nr:hypothetical protein [Rhizobium lentis]MBX5101021.1 hypothetical protein [Rhizobium lentis]